MSSAGRQAGPAQPPFNRGGGPLGRPPLPGHRVPPPPGTRGYPPPPPPRRMPPPPPRQRIPRGPAPRRRAGRPELTDAAVVSRSWGMAVATLVSRITGFIRIVLLAAILGAALSSAFSVAIPAAQPGRRAGAGGDVHRDLRAGAGPRRTRRPRRRHRVRPPPGHPGDHAAAGHHRVVGGFRAAAGPPHAGRRSAGEPSTHHRVRLPAAAPGDLLRIVLGVHGNPQHPQRVRAARLGTGGQQRCRDRHPRRVSRLSRASFRWIQWRWATPSCWCWASARRWACCADGRGAGRHPPGTDQPATAVGPRRPARSDSARWRRRWCSTC